MLRVHRPHTDQFKDYFKYTKMLTWAEQNRQRSSARTICFGVIGETHLLEWTGVGRQLPCRVIPRFIRVIKPWKLYGWDNCPSCYMAFSLRESTGKLFFQPHRQETLFFSTATGLFSFDGHGKSCNPSHFLFCTAYQVSQSQPWPKRAGLCLNINFTWNSNLIQKPNFLIYWFFLYFFYF